MLNDARAGEIFEGLAALLQAMELPSRQAPVYAQVFERVRRLATGSELFLPVDLPLATAAGASVDDAHGLRAARVATLLWAGADLMDDVADGDLLFDDWDVTPAQLALVYTNLLATLPHLAGGAEARAEFHSRLSEALWDMSHGQFTDLESAEAVTKCSDYQELIARKTGVETALFAELPLLLAGAGRETCERWAEFGFHVGCMVQAFTDVYSTFNTTGANDLRSGKRSYAVTHTLEQLTGPVRQSFLDDLASVAGGDDGRLEAVFSRVHERGGAQAALREVERSRFRAAAALPVPLRQLPGAHPLRRLLRCCSVLRGQGSSTGGARPRPSAPKPSTTGRTYPPAPRLHDGEAQAVRVADYYDEHTEPFYLRLWDGEDIHFGLFEAPHASLRDALKAMTQAILAPVRLSADSLVVDAGCGVGGAALDVAERSGARVVGFTISPRQVDIARARAEAAGCGERVRFEVADCAVHLPLPDASVDVVVTIEAGCHFADRQRFVQECRRVLRPGGWLVGSDWIRTVDECDGEHGAAIRAVEQAWRLSSLATIGEWQGALKGVGFEIVGLEDFAARVHRNAELLAHSLSDLQLEAAQPDEGTGSLALWIDQCATLLQAWTIGAFSIARFCALRP